MGDVENKLQPVVEEFRAWVALMIKNHDLDALEYETLLDLITGEIEEAPKFEDFVE